MIVINYTSVSSLQRSLLYQFNRLHSSIEKMISFSGVSTLIDYQMIVIDYFILKSVPISDQEYFNRLCQESNRLHCS